MTLDEYQQKCLRTWVSRGSVEADLQYLGLSIAGEAGELANKVKKLYHHHPLGMVVPGVLEEDGDVMWYVAVIAHVLGLKLSQLAQANIAKLVLRYPEGFDPERSINRPEGNS